METVWTFETARFKVKLQIEDSEGYAYDGDDEDGETQRLLDSGVYRAFDSRVVVYLDGAEIASDSLGASVYENPSDFWTAHRDRDPMNRNCSIMRGAQGDNMSICHCFPSMVLEAIRAARAALANRPSLRAA